MNFYKIYPTLILIIFFQLLLVSTLLAQTTQVITGHINADFSASIDQSLPLDTNEYSDINLTIPRDLGSKAVDYSLVGAYDTQGPITMTSIGTYEYNLCFNKSYIGVQGMHLQYQVPPAFVSPIFIGYDFSPVLDDIFFKKPTLDLTYPSNLELVDVFPSSLLSNPVHIEYPESKNSGIIEVNFIPNPLPDGYTKADQGLFTLIAKPNQVERLKRLVKPLTFIPEAFKTILGIFDLEHVYIIVADFAGQGHLLTELGGFMRTNNILIIDPSNFTSGASDLSLRKIVIHELTHSIVSRNTYHKEEKYAPWFDEGMAVFMENRLGETYLGDTDYYIAPNQNGYMTVWQELDMRFSESQLLLRYNQNQFDFDVPTNSEDAIDDYYTHAGLVFYNFYLTVGDHGMRTFIQRLSQLYSCGYVKDRCDTDKILGIMSEISGLNRDQLLFPFRNYPNFSQKIKPLTRNEVSGAQTDSIMANYENNKNTQTLKSKKDITDIKQDLPVIKVESKNIQTDKPKSFFTKIGFWFINLFK